MSEPRKALIFVGTNDVGDVAQLGLQTTARLASDGLLTALVCGKAGSLLQAAAAAGLPTFELQSSAGGRHAAWAVEQQASSADLVHALGLDAALLVASTKVADATPLVVSVDRVGHRRHLPWPQLSPYSVFRARSPMRWLVHGAVSTSRLVDSGQVRGDQVVTLPMLPFAESSRPHRPEARAAARRRLSLAPGAHVVFGAGPRESAGFRCLEAAVRADRRDALIGIWIDTGHGHKPGGRRQSGLIVVTPAEGKQLLPGMDVLLSDGTPLAARHPAVDARHAGVPIVTTATDVAAALVHHSLNGYVCKPSQLGTGVTAAIEMAVTRTLHHRPAERRRAERSNDTVAATVHCYSSILGHPLVRPVLIGRGAAR